MHKEKFNWLTTSFNILQTNFSFPKRNGEEIRNKMWHLSVNNSYSGVQIILRRFTESYSTIEQENGKIKLIWILKRKRLFSFTQYWVMENTYQKANNWN